ncbi:MAG: hypothetical protein ACLPZR_01290 [Solirubrobacteraceae bacterium]
MDTMFEMGNSAVNFAFPDTGAVYWGAQITMPAGSTIVLDGQFAHARYQSLTAYSPATHVAIESLDDVATEPDLGSVNPYQPGADRDADQRSYTVTVDDQPPPAQKAPNTLYAGASGEASQQLIYRVYLPDAAQPTEVTGGVGLPIPVLHLADGTVETGASECQTLDAVAGPFPETLPPASAYAQWRDQAGQPPTFPAAPTPQFQTFDWNWLILACLLYGSCGNYGNPDNGYMWAYVNRGFPAGPVLVLRGELPSTPTTGIGVHTMGTGQMRYWSMCQNSVYSTMGAGCVNDGDIPLNAQRDYTIVTSLPQDRPANATLQCGVAWIPWPAQGDGDGNLNDGLLLVRNLLPDPSFTHAIQNAAPWDVQSVLGPYYPQGAYTTTAAFQQLGCPA